MANKHGIFSHQRAENITRAEWIDLPDFCSEYSIHTPHGLLVFTLDRNGTATSFRRYDGLIVEYYKLINIEA